MNAWGRFLENGKLNFIYQIINYIKIKSTDGIVPRYCTLASTLSSVWVTSIVSLQLSNNFASRLAAGSSSSIIITFILIIYQGDGDGEIIVSSSNVHRLFADEFIAVADIIQPDAGALIYLAFHLQVIAYYQAAIDG